MSKIRQAIASVRLQLGWQGTYGIALLLIAGAFHFLALQPLEQEASLMHSRMDAAQHRGGIGGAKPSLGERQAELRAFFNSLPNETDVTDVLASMYLMAEACGIQFKEASYHLEERDRPRLEYVVNFPVSGDYQRIRMFIFSVLYKHHAIALDQVDFQRDRVGDTSIKANIRMTLFLRPST